MARILIVEDEAKIARFLELELSHEGYEVDKVADGRSGVDKALEGDYDLILLDVLLPQLNGMEVLRRIRRESDVPVIMLTEPTTTSPSPLPSKSCWHAFAWHSSGARR